MREDPHCRQCIKAYVAYTFWYLYMVILTFVFGQMTIPFFSSDYLWLIGIEFGLIREFNQWVMNKLIFKAAETNDFYSIGALNLQLVTLTNLTILVFISTDRIRTHRSIKYINQKTFERKTNFKHVIHIELRYNF